MRSTVVRLASIAIRNLSAPSEKQRQSPVSAPENLRIVEAEHDQRHKIYCEKRYENYQIEENKDQFESHSVSVMPFVPFSPLDVFIVPSHMTGYACNRRNIKVDFSAYPGVVSTA